MISTAHSQKRDAQNKQGTSSCSGANRSSLRCHRVEGITHKHRTRNMRTMTNDLQQEKFLQAAKSNISSEAGHPHLQFLTLYWPFEATRRLTTTPICSTKKRQRCGRLKGSSRDPRWKRCEKERSSLWLTHTTRSQYIRYVFLRDSSSPSSGH